MAGQSCPLPGPAAPGQGLPDRPFRSRTARSPRQCGVSLPRDPDVSHGDAGPDQAGRPRPSLPAHLRATALPARPVAQGREPRWQRRASGPTGVAAWWADHDRPWMFCEHEIDGFVPRPGPRPGHTPGRGRAVARRNRPSVRDAGRGEPERRPGGRAARRAAADARGRARAGLAVPRLGRPRGHPAGSDGPPVAEGRHAALLRGHIGIHSVDTTRLVPARPRPGWQAGLRTRSGRRASAAGPLGP